MLRMAPKESVIIATVSFVLATGAFQKRSCSALASLPFFRSQNRPSTTCMNLSKKKESPSAERNKAVIWETLSTRVLPGLSNDIERNFNVVEVAAGAGIHTEFFGRQCQQAFPNIRWFPSDPDPESLASQYAYIKDTPALEKIMHTPPLSLTLSENGIQEADTRKALDDKAAPLDLILCINMVHISPWSATIGLIKEAGLRLRPGGILYLYGPYRVNGTCTESNVKFEQWLHSMDPGYGVRNLEDVTNLAEEQGLTLQESIEMPANNLSLLYRKL